jgi:hypothetical protein
MAPATTQRAERARGLRPLEQFRSDVFAVMPEFRVSEISTVFDVKRDLHEPKADRFARWR